MKTAIALLVAVVVPFGTVVLAGVVANHLLRWMRQRRSAEAVAAIAYASSNHAAWLWDGVRG